MLCGAVPPDRDDLAPRCAKVNRVRWIDAGLDQGCRYLVSPVGRQAEPPPGCVDQLVEAGVVGS